jgi:DoxX
MALNTGLIWAYRAAKAILLIRVLGGWIFLSEGIQKFLFPDSLGVGRFVKIGIPWSQVMAPFVGIVEIVCSTLCCWSVFLRGLQRCRSSSILPLPCTRPRSLLRQERVLGHPA